MTAGLVQLKTYGFQPMGKNSFFGCEEDIGSKGSLPQLHLLGLQAQVGQQVVCHHDATGANSVFDV